MTKYFSVSRFFIFEHCATHTVENTETLCGNYANSLSYIFGKHFVKVTGLLKKLMKVDLTKFFSVKKSKFFITVRNLCILTLFWRIFRESNILTTFRLQKRWFHEFLFRLLRVIFRFHTMQWRHFVDCNNFFRENSLKM